MITRSSPVRRSILDRNFTKIFAAALTCLSAQAADLVWDNDGATPGNADGGGTWDLTLPNWWNGSTNVAWTNLATPNNAYFGTGDPGGVVTLATAITVDDLSFQNTGYTLTGATLTLGGPNTPVIS